MTIKQFVKRHFKNSVHAEMIETMFSVYGENTKTLTLYLQKNFQYKGMVKQGMSLEKLDLYMKNLNFYMSL